MADTDDTNKKETADVDGGPAPSPDRKTESDAGSNAGPNAGKEDAPVAQKKNGGLGFKLWATVALLVLAGVGYLTWPVWRAPVVDGLRANLPAPVAEMLPGNAAPAPDPVSEPVAAAPAPAPTPAPAPEPAPQPEPAPAPEPMPAPEPAPQPAPESAPSAEPAAPVTPDPAATADVDTVDRAEMDAAARRVAALERALADMAEQVAALTARLDEQAARPTVAAPDPVRETGMSLLLLGQVQGDLMAGAPYGDALAALTRTLETDAVAAPLLARLRTHAETGVQTPYHLATGFDAAARAIAEAIARDELTAAGEAVGDGVQTPGWLSRIWEKLSSMVVVRRIGAPGDATGPRALLARAEAAVAAGDLAAASTALAGLSGAPADAAAPWRAAVAARADADQAFAQLKTALLARDPHTQP